MKALSKRSRCRLDDIKYESDALCYLNCFSLLICLMRVVTKWRLICYAGAQVQRVERIHSVYSYAPVNVNLPLLLHRKPTSGVFVNGCFQTRGRTNRLAVHVLSIEVLDYLKHEWDIPDIKLGFLKRRSTAFRCTSALEQVMETQSSRWTNRVTEFGNQSNCPPFHQFPHLPNPHSREAGNRWHNSLCMEYRENVNCFVSHFWLIWFHGVNSEYINYRCMFYLFHGITAISASLVYIQLSKYVLSVLWHYDANILDQSGSTVWFILQ